MTGSFLFDAEQRERFRRDGLVRLPGFYPRHLVAEMADKVWADLERRFGRRRDQPETWTGPARGKFQALKRSGAFRALRSPELVALADDLMGPGGWSEPAHWGFLLVTFPGPGATPVRPAWHLDIFGDQALEPLPILRVFTFLEPVEPGCGGTLCLAGSHRLARAIEQAAGAPVRSEQVCRTLRARGDGISRLLDAPNAELEGLIGQEIKAGGSTVRLEEMTGAAGDLIVMHPAIAHGAAVNRGSRPRIMLTEWLVRANGAPA